MNYIEYGAHHSDILLFLHGGGLGTWNFREAAELLGRRFRVILPVLDGHAEARDDFISIEENARRIISFIDALSDGHVLFIGGLSLGAQIAAEVLAQRPDICRCALLESPSLIPSPALAPCFSSAWAPVYRLTQYRWFARLQFTCLHIRQELFEEYFESTRNISTENLLSFLKSCLLYKLNPSISRTRARVLIVCGEKEPSVIRRSAHLLHEALPQSTLTIKKGLHHGEFSLNHSDMYVRELLDWLKL